MSKMNKEEQAKKLVSLGSLFVVLKQQYKGIKVVKYEIESTLKQNYF
jgi:hypothetical protein